MSTDRDVPQAIDAFTADVRREVDGHLQKVLERAGGDARAAVERAVASRVAAMRQEHAREIEAKLESERVQHARDVEARVLAVRSELAGAIKPDAHAAEIDARVAEARADAQFDFDMRLASERAMFESTLASMKYELREDQADAFGRLLESVRRIDDQDSLRGIFEALARAAAADASRVVVFVVDGDHLRPWGQFGFANDQTPSEIEIGSAGPIAAAVAVRQPSFVASTGEAAQGLPSFMRLSPGAVGLLVPLVVGDDVVAVLYADGLERHPGEETASPWTDQVELLARHAALRLENVTSRRAAEGLAKS